MLRRILFVTTHVELVPLFPFVLVVSSVPWRTDGQGTNVLVGSEKDMGMLYSLIFYTRRPLPVM